MRKSNYGKKPPMSKKSKKIMAGVIGTGILVAVIIFFSYYKVDSVEIRGTSHYTDEEVKNMVLRGPMASNSVLAPLIYSTTNTDDIAYVDAFKVTQLNRNTICISVKEKKAVGCIRYLDSYIYFDRNGIFVEGSQNRDETVPYFDGIQVNSIVMDEKLDIRGDTVLNTAVALSTIFQKNDMIPDHIQFDSSYSISLIYGDVTVQLGKDVDLEEKMNRVIAILPQIQGKKGILHMESVTTDSNTFEEEQEEVTAENWNGGYDEEGNYTGDGEYDEDGNYVGEKPKTALEEAIENWNGGYDEEGDYTGAGEYDESGNYVGPKPTQESLDAADDESGDGSGDENSTDSQWSDTSGDGADDTSYDESSSGGDGDYTEDNGDYSEDDSEGY
nr:cell division protein FtsQ/DivIB [uncultured Blautia sp.]